MRNRILLTALLTCGLAGPAAAGGTSEAALGGAIGGGIGAAIGYQLGGRDGSVVGGAIGAAAGAAISNDSRQASAPRTVVVVQPGHSQRPLPPGLAKQGKVPPGFRR